MATDAFLKLEGVKGESKDSKHPDEIELLSWSWGASQPGSMHTSGGGGVGKASFSDLSIQKFVDSSSPTLWKFLTKGSHFATGTFVQRKAGGEQVEYFVIDLKKILVSSVSTGGSGGDEQLTESISLNFEEFKLSYVPQKDDGTAGAAIDFGWNIAENVEK
ncbi:MAG: type VI secretion system tube protein Hcp [Salinisphaera sp.]|nr:type VI secretion system tube protein Hcp [Salinisphaera sp.]